ncbi:MAG: sel1 repeat family protein [Oscillibacter sp.]|nr:sel1 repeat family protein [Oscillibacter sp.]
MQYRYCLVRPKNIDKAYYYLSDEAIPEKSYVLVPLGHANRLHKGVVEAVSLCTEETAPFPVNRTKSILRTITPEEYDADEDAEWRRYAETFIDDIEELSGFLSAQDYDAVFQWACEHHECTRFPDIMETVIRCYRLCMKYGHPGAALNLGTLYYNGTYLKQDFEQAVKLYEIAAEAGERRALCNLGYCYYYGRHQPPDYEKAYHYYQLGALLFDDPNCLYKLGDMYRMGLYVAENETYAVRLYFRALDAVNRPEEDDFCRADILERIGEAFLYGIAVECDAKKALDLLMQSLSGFYERRKTDPYVSGLIAHVKEKIQEAQDLLDEDLPG